MVKKLYSRLQKKTVHKTVSLCFVGGARSLMRKGTAGGGRVFDLLEGEHTDLPSARLLGQVCSNASVQQIAYLSLSLSLST